MRPIEEPGLCKFLRWIVGAVYPKMELVGLENLPEEPFVLVGNHSQAHGAIIAEERLPFDLYTWCNYQMMEKKEVCAYALEDFWQDKPRAMQPVYWLLSRLIQYPAVYILSHARTIAVYHDNRCISTFRKSLEKLQEGYNLVIYPESREGKKQGMHRQPCGQHRPRQKCREAKPVFPQAQGIVPQEHGELGQSGKALGQRRVGALLFRQMDDAQRAEPVQQCLFLGSNGHHMDDIHFFDHRFAS